ncbi:hypothetical protein [Legionella longbeachae]|uniref:Uncharacterized protein n=1 Tax=Legionella longbeachae serogroup 1 (strain NSW150) TaxID=661367 RepID=D3HJB1_LEGLN|nr:hypothetical protein [Legionella longbeachae]VEE03047.1 Uncharacterised protein [Legionella oakridgensis]HBD7398726.1 hypothetical protein [Legionella pneumophila]EEZ94390.1 hypothetical protein LLB_3295 [Legionella longbeachae D-4968]UAK46071.1 hypothetical protein K8O86_15060 [Legionella longbeachae]CBJ12500.1 hypothetical protein LLO_2110 [Legionella longbeachae NSW150]
MINKFILLTTVVDKNQDIIQMNAQIKNMSVELLKLSRESINKLKRAALIKIQNMYHEM